MRSFRPLCLLTGAMFVLALALGPAISAGTPKPVQEVVQSGDTQAVLSYDKSTGRYGMTTYANITLQISRAGSTLYDQAVPRYGPSEPLVWPFDYPKKAISLRHLDGPGPPEVVLNLYWGGAHCCEWTRVYRYDSASDNYTVTQHLWGDPGYKLEQIGNQLLFVSADDRFAYAFTDFADSVMPIQIWSYAAGNWQDVTRAHKPLIKREAAELWQAYLAAAHQRREPRGILAAWAADEFELGQRAQASAQLEQLAGSGALNSALSGVDTPADPHPYVRALLRFLHKNGYG